MFAFIPWLTCHHCVCLSPLCPSVAPVSICRPCVWLSPLCLAVAPVSGCRPAFARLSPLCPSITMCPAVTTVSICCPCVQLSPLCPTVTTVSICHHCVYLSPLCPSVTPVSLCHPCVRLSPLCPQHWRTRSQRSSLSIPVHCCPQFWVCAGACEAPLQTHSLQWTPLFSGVGTTTQLLLGLACPPHSPSTFPVSPHFSRVLCHACGHSFPSCPLPLISHL